MSFQDLIYCCRKLVSAYEICDELWFMRLYNEETYKAFDKYMVQTIERIKELCEEELEK